MTQPKHTKPYQYAALFSGGGSRFGYYCGMYAALVEFNQKPDLIIATCGGAIAAGLVELAPEPENLFTLLTSQPCYDMMSRFQANTPRSCGQYVCAALKRLAKAKLSSTHNREVSQRDLNELTELALFYIQDENSSPWFDKTGLRDVLAATHQVTHAQQPDIIMLASRLVPSQVKPKTSQTRAKYQFEQVGFAPEHLLNYLTDLSYICPVHAQAPKRIHADLAWLSWQDHHLKDAVRASMTDMFYFAPHHIGDEPYPYLGGVIDLTPVELAGRISTQVFAETKAPYNKVIAEPAIRHVFGFSANARLNHVHDFMQQTHADCQIHCLPFACNETVLADAAIKRKLNWLSGKAEITMPSYTDFQQMMKAQWDYGYRTTYVYLSKNKKTIAV